jgi:hypothetical protein
MLRVALTFLWLFVLASCEAIAGIPDVRMEPSKSTDDGGPSAAGGCKEFCELAYSLCDEEFTIYQPMACATACPLYSEEERKCREDELKQLQNSGKNERYLYCPRASLGGGNGACGGTPCQNYCRTMSKVCSEHAEGMVTYPDADGMNAEACEAKCAVIPDKEDAILGAGDSTFDVMADHEGDTIQCRLVHLTLATQSEKFATEHCEHAFISPQPMGGRTPWCGAPLANNGEPTCDDYCAINLAACTDDFEVYDDLAQCRAVCKSFEPGTLAMNAQENTLACRKYHSYNAAVYANPKQHCPHSGPGGAVTCGDDCESMCKLLETGCPSEYEEEYDGSSNNCEQACDTARKADPMYMGGASYSIKNAKLGHAFACRLYHATIAATLSNDDALECGIAIGKQACPFPEDP